MLLHYKNPWSIFVYNYAQTQLNFCFDETSVYINVGNSHVFGIVSVMCAMLPIHKCER